MPLTIIGQDNFTRPNENPLSDGGHWSKWNPLPNMPEIASNVCQPSVLSTDCAAYWSAISWPNDQWSKMIIGNLATAGTHSAILFLRMDSSVLTSYEAIASPSPSTYAIRKFIAGVGTTLATTTTTPKPGDIVLFSVQGTTLTLTVNGIQIGQTNDSSIASGNAGIDVFSSTVLNDATLTLWQGGDFSTPSYGWLNSHRSFINKR